MKKLIAATFVVLSLLLVVSSSNMLQPTVGSNEIIYDDPVYYDADSLNISDSSPIDAKMYFSDYSEEHESSERALTENDNPLQIADCDIHRIGNLYESNLTVVHSDTDDLSKCYTVSTPMYSCLYHEDCIIQGRSSNIYGCPGNHELQTNAVSPDKNIFDEDFVDEGIAISADKVKMNTGMSIFAESSGETQALDENSIVDTSIFNLDFSNNYIPQENETGK